MRNQFQTKDFPKQKVPNSQKDKVFAANCSDWIIAQAQGMRDTKSLNEQYEILRGNIPPEFYKKILNPYNSTNENFTRFPATMRHYDLIKGVIRRYVSEYIKNPHDFMIGANNPEIVLARNAKLSQELAKIVEQKIAAAIQESYQQFLSEGNDPQDFNPQQAIDVEAFIKKFNEEYIDDVSAQAQEIFNVIRDITEDSLFYAKAYFDFVTFGECYTYATVKGNKLIKENVEVRDAFPVTTDNFFREDDGAFARRRKMTYSEIMDEFEDDFSQADINFMETYYAKEGPAAPAELAFSVYESYFPEVCGKFSAEERKLFDKSLPTGRDGNNDLYDVWHTVWQGYTRVATVTFINEAGLIDVREELDSYTLQPELGDISIEHYYKPQVYECVRIGTYNQAIYPYGCRAIAYDRGGKLPYNGVNELLPGFGKFSIIDVMMPYNIFYDIVSYHREMAIAKNKLSILLIAKSLLGDVPEETIYKILADGVLYFDDTNDAGMLRAQQIRMVNTDISAYITQLTAMLADIENTAKAQVDMTPQRYGEIANSAGKGVTDEAIIRGSMGSVIIEYIMDSMRERDYARDLDYSKLAWIDGLDTSYRDADENLKYISLNVEQHLYADYIIKAKNSAKERERFDALKQLAFNASQNGELLTAVAAITGDNVAQIVKTIKKFDELKKQHEQSIAQLEQQTAQMEAEQRLREIEAKGVEDRKTLELKGAIDSEIELIKADANMISFDNGVDNSEKELGMQRLQQYRAKVDQQKNDIARTAMTLDAFSKAEDRRVKEKDIEAKIQIAKSNRNRYDFKSKSKTK